MAYVDLRRTKRHDSQEKGKVARRLFCSAAAWRGFWESETAAVGLRGRGRECLCEFFASTGAPISIALAGWPMRKGVRLSWHRPCFVLSGLPKGMLACVSASFFFIFLIYLFIYLFIFCARKDIFWCVGLGGKSRRMTTRFSVLTFRVHVSLAGAVRMV